MKGFIPWSIFLLFMSIPKVFGQEKTDYEILTVAFYNLENLFDTENDPLTFDDDRTPEGKDRWTTIQYEDKLKKLAYVISKIGHEETGQTPALVGVSEVENLRVLDDLINEPSIASSKYGIIHFDSPDQRGIDVALLYKTDLFVPKLTKAYELILYDSQEPGKRVYTRDQLLVTGLLEGEEIHLLVNHWPSRSGGVSRSSYKRGKAAALNRSIIDTIQQKNPYAKIITMGDFNDDPGNRSMKQILKAKDQKEKLDLKDLYNPMAALAKQGLGSSAYRDGWSLFDQMVVSKPLLEKDYSSFRLYRAKIFNPGFLTTPSGQYRGYPFRSFGSSGYTGGYSDHYPVYALLIRNLN